MSSDFNKSGMDNYLKELAKEYRRMVGKNMPKKQQVSLSICYAAFRLEKCKREYGRVSLQKK